MFDLANYYSTSPVLLDEHFRSFAPIIDFSNSEFYGARMRVMTKNLDKKDVLELCLVPDGKVDRETTRNMAETEAIIKRLHEIILEDEQEQTDKEPVSIGIISPFRGQVDLLQKALSKVFSETTIRKHSIEVGTAHTFQGDERDIMIISWTVADNSFVQSLTFLQKPNLFNVAITRARKKMISFLSKDPKSLPAGLLRDYIEYVQAYESRNNLKELAENNEETSNLAVKCKVKLDENIYKNKFERIVADFLRCEGFEVIAGMELAGFSTDLIVRDPIGTTILIECDGLEDSKKINCSQVKKHTILERSGMKIVRVSYREWHHSSQACLERIKQAIIE